MMFASAVMFFLEGQKTDQTLLHMSAAIGCIGVTSFIEGHLISKKFSQYDNTNVIFIKLEELKSGKVSLGYQSSEVSFLICTT